MSMVHVPLPAPLQRVIDREVGQGRVANRVAFMIEAARRFADELAMEDEIVAEARAGISDADAGRFVTIGAPSEQAALHDQVIARLARRLADDGG